MGFDRRSKSLDHSFILPPNGTSREPHAGGTMYILFSKLVSLGDIPIKSIFWDAMR